MLWAWGPESWETATGGAFYFTLNTDVPCKVHIQEQIQWEYIFFCPVLAAGCHYPVVTQPAVDHIDLYEGKIVYDLGIWVSLNNAERRALSAHEMGHGVGLQDHFASACAQNTLMGLIDQPPCYEIPTIYDALGAMDAHGYFD